MKRINAKNAIQKAVLAKPAIAKPFLFLRRTACTQPIMLNIDPKCQLTIHKTPKNQLSSLMPANKKKNQDAIAQEKPTIEKALCLPLAVVCVGETDTVPVGFPHALQYTASSGKGAPHSLQYILPPPNDFLFIL